MKYIDLNMMKICIKYISQLNLARVSFIFILSLIN